MEKNKKSELMIGHFHMLFSEGASLSFLRFFDDNKENMLLTLEKWSEPVLDASGATFCKTLVTKGLLAQKNGKIMLSYIDLIYVEVLRVAVNYGANANIIAGIKELFDEQHNKSFTSIVSPLAEILFNGHSGFDVEFTFQHDGDSLEAYDYHFAPFFLAKPHEPMMHFSIIPILNIVRSYYKNLKPISVKHSLYDGFVFNSSEIEAIELMRNLKEAESLEIKPYKSEPGRFIASIKDGRQNELFAQAINAVCDQFNIASFSDIAIKRRNGGVTNVDKREQKVI